MQPLGCVRSLAVELEDGRAWGAYGSGELLHGRVQLELRAPLRLRALEVCARGRATTHWLESHSVGFNTIYRDYTAYQTFLHRRCQLVPEISEAVSQTGFPFVASWPSHAAQGAQIQLQPVPNPWERLLGKEGCGSIRVPPSASRLRELERKGLLLRVGNPPGTAAGCDPGNADSGRCRVQDVDGMGWGGVGWNGM
ncbi:arrestin domain-containing protein 3-like [Leptosomus discolor]